MKYNKSTQPSLHPETDSNRHSWKVKMLIVDDDPIASAVIRKQLELAFPGSIVHIKSVPVIIPGYHIYLLDNDFQGEYMASNLVREARAVEPSSLIVALSTTLDLTTFNQMVNDGCNAVFDKQDPQDSHQAKQVISNYISVLKEASNLRGKGLVPGLVASVGRLLREWNQRLVPSQNDLAGKEVQK